MTKETGGSAFPLTRESSFGKNYEGMTLRDWFAGQAIAGTVNFPDAPDFATAAKQAYALASAMIAEKSKP